MRRARDAGERADLLWVLHELLDNEQHSGQIEAAVERGLSANIQDYAIFCAGATWGQEKLQPRLREMELQCMPYREYLDTPEWAERRDAARRADGNRCRVCNGGHMLEVHHRTYERRGREAPADLVTLCHDCHGTFHEHRQLSRARA